MLIPGSENLLAAQIWTVGSPVHIDGHGAPPSLLHGLKLGQAEARRAGEGPRLASHGMAVNTQSYHRHRCLRSLPLLLPRPRTLYLPDARVARAPMCISLRSPFSSPFCRFQLPIPCRIPFTIWMKARLQGSIITRTSLSLVFMFVSRILEAPPPKQRLVSWLPELPRLREFRDGELVLEFSSVRFLKSCCREIGTWSWLRMLCD